MTCCIFALAFVFLCFSAAFGTPKVRLDKTEIDFKKIEEGETASEKLTLRNVGDASVTVRKLSSSSPGLTATIEEKVVEAGKSSEIEVKFATAGISPCRLVKYVYIQVVSDGGEAEPGGTDELNIPVTCRATIRPKSKAMLQIQPFEVDFGVIMPGETPSEQVILTNIGTADLEIEPVQYVDSKFEILGSGKITLKPGGDNKDNKLFVRYKGGEKEFPGRFEGMMLIKSNTADGPYTKVVLKGFVAEQSVAVTGVMDSPPPPKEGEEPETGKRYLFKVGNYYEPYKVKVTMLNGTEKGKSYDVGIGRAATRAIEFDPEEKGKKISLQVDIIIEEPPVEEKPEEEPEEVKPEGEGTSEEKKEEPPTPGAEKEGEEKPEGGVSDDTPEEAVDDTADAPPEEPEEDKPEEGTETEDQE